MNVAMIFRILGWMLMFEAAFMAPSGIVAAVYKESDVVWLLVSMGICLAAGAVMVLVSRPKIRRIYAREGSVICALVWFLYSIFGALPFFLSGYITRFIDAVFETASGFTTTGASILSDVEALPHWLLFWRSFTHWVGGMGILVFVMAIIPLAAGGSTMYLMNFPIVILNIEIKKLDLINPRTIVIALPKMGRKEKKPIKAPRPCINRSALSSSSCFTCR